MEREGIYGNTDGGRSTGRRWSTRRRGPRRRVAGDASGQAHGRHGPSVPWPETTGTSRCSEEYRSFGLGTGRYSGELHRLTRTRGMLWPVVNGKETPYRYTAGYDPYVKKATGAHFYKGGGLRRKGGLLDSALPSAGGGAGRRLSLLAHDGACARAWNSGSMTQRIPQLHRPCHAVRGDDPGGRRTRGTRRRRA